MLSKLRIERARFGHVPHEPQVILFTATWREREQEETGGEMKREKQRTTVFHLIDLLPMHFDKRHNAKKRPEAEVAVHCLPESEKTKKKPGEF